MVADTPLPGDRARPENEPRSVWTGSFRIFGVDVKCSVLDDGHRIVDADSFAALVQAMEAPDNGADLGDLSGFNRWRLGVTP